MARKSGVDRGVTQRTGRDGWWVRLCSLAAGVGVLPALTQALAVTHQEEGALRSLTEGSAVGADHRADARV